MFYKITHLLLLLFAFSIFPKETSSSKEANKFLQKANHFLYKKKDPESAMKNYSLAIDKNPNFAKAYFNLGIARSQLKGFLGAVKDFEKALKLKPDFYEVYLKTAEIKKILKRNNEAILDYTSYIKFKPKDPLGYYLRAESIGNSDKKSALADINIAIKLNPKFTNAYLLRGKLNYYDREKFPVKDFEKVIQLNPNCAEAYYLLAEKNHINVDKSDEARIAKANLSFQYLNQALKINPNYVDALVGKAYVYERLLFDIDSAIEQYNLFLKIKPDTLYAIESRVDLKIKNKNYEEAKTEILSIEKKLPLHWFRIGEIEQLKSNFLEAEKAFTVAIDLQIKNYDFKVDYFYYRARNRVKLKNYEGALEDYNTLCSYVSYQFYNPNHFYERAFVKKKLKLNTEAIDDFSSAITQDSSNEYYFYDRGNAKYLLKDFVGAYEDYNRAIEMNSTLGIFFQARGYTLIQMNDYHLAREDLLKATDYLPDNREIQIDLEVLDILLRNNTN